MNIDGSNKSPSSITRGRKITFRFWLLLLLSFVLLLQLLSIRDNSSLDSDKHNAWNIYLPEVFYQNKQKFMLRIYCPKIYQKKQIKFDFFFKACFFYSLKAINEKMGKKKMLYTLGNSLLEITLKCNRIRQIQITSFW